MWFDEDLMFGARRRGNRRPRGVAESILMVNARLAEQRKERRRRWGTFALVTVVVTGLAWGGMIGARVAGRVLFTENEQFSIRHLDLASDGKLQPGHIKEYAGLQEGANLFAVDVEQVRRRLESVPVVERAEIYRRLPDTLIVRVSERVPLAKIGTGDDPLPLAVDREGHVLGPSALSPNLPTLTGIREGGLRPGSVLRGSSVADALMALSICDSTRLSQYIKIRSIDVSDAEHLELLLEDGERVLLARDRIEPNLRKVAATLQTCRERGTRPVLLDATGDSHVVARYR